MFEYYAGGENDGFGEIDKAEEDSEPEDDDAAVTLDVHQLREQVQNELSGRQDQEQGGYATRRSLSSKGKERM